MSDEERLIALESKNAYLENFLNELNEVVIEQGKVIKTLLEETEMLKRELEEGKGALPDKEKPPHY